MAYSVPSQSFGVGRISAKKLGENIEEMKRRFPAIMVGAMYDALSTLGQLAASENMVVNSTSSGVYSKAQGRPVAGRLTWRSGRLARSLVGQFNSGETLEMVRLVPEGRHTVVANADSIVGRLQSFVPYAARHEYGGAFPITARARRFFYARYKETGDKMWLALFLKGKMGLPIITPARPYLRPALRSESFKSAAREIIEGALNRLIAISVGRET